MALGGVPETPHPIEETTHDTKEDTMREHTVTLTLTWEELERIRRALSARSKHWTNRAITMQERMNERGRETPEDLDAYESAVRISTRYFEDEVKISGILEEAFGNADTVEG